jgi:hypothetical protein
MIQSTSWTLHEAVGFDRNGITSRDWSGYPILTMPEVPEIFVSLLDSPWVAKPLGQPLEEFPNVARWRGTIKQRPAVQRGSIWARICAGRPRHPTMNGGSYSTRESGTCRSVRENLSRAVLAPAS